MLDTPASNARNSWWPSIACLAPLLLIAVRVQAQFGVQPVGVTSSAQQIQVTATSPGALARVEVLTLGSPTGDFAATNLSTCVPSTFAIGATCTLPIAFTPAASGLRMGAVLLIGSFNGTDTVLGVTYLSGTGMVESTAPVPEKTIHAATQTESSGNLKDGNGTQQSIDPRTIAIDGAGNSYIADGVNNRILMVCGPASMPVIHGTACAAAGAISTIAGNGDAAYAGDNGPALSAALNQPAAVAVDGAGNLLIADTGNNAIRMVDAVTGAIATVAGNANSAICAAATNPMGDGCPATRAILNQPQTIAVNGDGNLIIGDSGNGATRFVKRSTGVISTLAVASTTTTVVSSLDPAGFGQNVTFTVTVSAAANSGRLAGTVGIADTCNGVTVTLASGLPLNASGTVTFTTSVLAVGQHSVVASYNNANDPAHGASTSSPLVESVLEGTAVSLASSANPAVVGQSVTFTANVASLGGGLAPTGTIVFYDGSAVLAAPAIGATGAAWYATATLANGLHRIVAVYSGSPGGEVEASTSPAIEEDVQALSSISVSSSANPSTYGLAVTFTATVVSSATSPATGTVNFLDNGASIGSAMLAGNPAAAALTIASLSAGMHRITAVYAGDGKNQPSSSSASPLSQTVAQAQTVTAISVAPASGVAGEQEIFTATVALAQGSAPLAGTVDFASGTTLLGSASLNASGVAAISLTLAAGNYPLVASYEGNANALGSASNLPACSVVSPAVCSGSGPLLYTVFPDLTQTVLVVSPANAVAASPVAFTATVTTAGLALTGSVNFLANGIVIGTAALNGGTASFTDSSLPAGSYTVTAEYLGNANAAVSTSAGVSETVIPIPTVTALTSAAATGADPQVTLTATVTGNGANPAPGGTVTWMNGGTVLGTAALNANGVATLSPILVAGTNYSIDAVYSGDAYHAPSASQPIAVAGVASDFMLTVAPSAVAISPAQSATVTVTITSIASFTGTIALACASLPAMVNCSFVSARLNLPAGGTATTQLTIAAESSHSAQAAAIRPLAGSGSLARAGLLPPLSLVFAWLFPHRRRRKLRLFLMLPMLVLAAAGMAGTGCRAVLQPAASSGNFVIQITGESAAGNVVRMQNLSLDIAR